MGTTIGRRDEPPKFAHSMGQGLTNEEKIRTPRFGTQSTYKDTIEKMLAHFGATGIFTSRFVPFGEHHVNKLLVVSFFLGLTACADAEMTKSENVPIDIMALRSQAGQDGASAVAFVSSSGKGPVIQTASNEVRWYAFGTVQGSNLHSNVLIESYNGGELCTSRTSKWTGVCFQVFKTENESYPYVIVGKYGNGHKLKQKVRLKFFD